MKIPQIKWAQNDDYILIDIYIEPKDYEIKIANTSVYFKQDDYECNIILHANIIEDESKYSKNRIFEFKLKKEDDYEWVQLLKDKFQYNVSVNWDKWDISDEEDEDMPGGMPDMSQMMGGMPGGMPDMSQMMGGMPGGMPDMSQMMGEDVCQACPDDGECEKCNDKESYEDDFEISSDSEESDEKSQNDKSQDDKLEESNEEEPENHPVFDKECGDDNSQNEKSEDEKSEDRNTD